MPSIRIPITLRRALKAEIGSVVLSSPGVDGTQPQPPLTESDPRLQAFLRVNFDVFYDWNIQTGAVYFAEQLDDLLGLRHGGFPRSLEGWLGCVHPHDHDAVCADLWESVTDGRSFRGEYRLRRHDGTFLTMSDQGVVIIGEDGSPTNMIGAMRDATGDREAERARLEAEELRSVLFKIGKPAMQVDAAGDYVDAAPTALEFFRRGAEEMLAGNIRDDFPDSVLEPSGATPPSTRAASSSRSTARSPDEVKSLVLTVLPCHLSDGPGYFLLGTEITAQKELQRELTRSERALRRQATITDERNAALRVLLEQREQDGRSWRSASSATSSSSSSPSLERLSKPLRHRPERLEIEAVRENLREIVGPVLAARCAIVRATRRAHAARVRGGGHGAAGKTSDEIAAALHISQSAVSFHRANIRTKLGRWKGSPQLATHLAALAERCDRGRGVTRGPRDGRRGRAPPTGSRAARPRRRRAPPAPARP